MTSVLELFSGPLGPVLGLAIGAAILIALGVGMLSNAKKDRFEDLRAERESGGRSNETTAVLRSETRSDKFQRFSSFLEPQDAEELSAMRLTLMRAGYRGKDAVRIFHMAQFAGAILFLAVGLLYALAQQAGGAELTSMKMSMYVIGPGLFGYYLPRFMVNKRVKAREVEIVSGFPDSLDLMLVCVEAGQSIDQAIARVSKELAGTYPALGLEFMTVAQQMKAGKAKDQVFRDMAERCGVTDITSFCTTLIQSQTFGTSVGEALKVYAEEMRDKRVMRAEEKANTLPTKMTLATMGLTLPPLLIILLGPPVNQIIESLGSM